MNIPHIGTFDHLSYYNFEDFTGDLFAGLLRSSAGTTELLLDGDFTEPFGVDRGGSW